MSSHDGEVDGTGGVGGVGADARALADALPDGVVVADGDGRVVLVSAVAARMIGHDDGDALVGRPLGEALALRDHDDHDWVACTDPWGGLRTRTGVPEQSWLLPDGTEVLVSARIHRERRGGAVDRVVVALRSARGRARLDRERSDLVATVAHELRSPLTGVKGFVQALLTRWDRLNDEQKRLMLTTVSSDADRLSRLIAELLDVARIDTGRLQLNRRPVAPAVVAQRVVDSVSHSTSRPITLDAAAGGPDVLVDPDKLTQVLTNLVENAVRHGAGEVVVAIGAPTFGPVSRVAITVSDAGGGIPVELRARVFTKFWTGGRGGGSGLGLYIVHGLTRAHGGDAVIEDRPGGGTRIVTTWPVWEG